MWLILLETWGEHLLLHSKDYLILRTTQGSFPHSLQHHIPYLRSFLIASHLRAANNDRDDKSQLPRAHWPYHSRRKKIPVIYTFKWAWEESMTAQKNSLHKCRQLTVTASPAFLSKDVTCSEPGTVRSCKMSSPADWWKWLTLGCQLKDQLFTSTRQLPPTHQAAAGRRKGRSLWVVVNMHYPFLWPWSATIAKSIACSKLRNRDVWHQLHPKHLEI